MNHADKGVTETSRAPGAKVKLADEGLTRLLAKLWLAGRLHGSAQCRAALTTIIDIVSSGMVHLDVESGKTSWIRTIVDGASLAQFT